jgi:uncharacterized membrane-anchored protein
MVSFPTHPDREALVGEMHARPALPLTAPASVTRLALLGGDRAAQSAHLARLCAMSGAPAPDPEANHLLLDAGAFILRYERHTEFAGLTFLRSGGADFREPAISAVPQDWLASWPGQTIAACHILLSPSGAAGPDRLARDFAAGSLSGARVAAGAATVFTDFRLHADGSGRFLVENSHLTDGEAGRLVQSLWELETYRLLALLALPQARAVAPKLADASARLGTLAERMPAAEGLDDERALLEELTDLAEGIERAAAATQDRFSAARAYHALVKRRLADLREEALPGLSTLSGFLDRRLDPAIATVDATSARIEALSRRTGRAVELLRARVALAQEAQSEKQLAALAETGRAQLRLQQTVEGLSVAAISYYLVSLAGYAIKPFSAGGISGEAIVAGLVPIVAGYTWYVVRRKRREATGG